MPLTRIFVLFRSAFRRPGALNISHETVDDVKTLCGRLVSSAETREPDERGFDADCHICARAAQKLRAKS